MLRSSFSTDMLPATLSAEKKAWHWAEICGARRGFSRFFVDCPIKDGFKATIDGLALDQVEIGSTIATSLKLERAKRQVARDGNDDIMLILSTDVRPLAARQMRREGELRRGDAVVVSLDEPSMVLAQKGGRAFSINIPRRLLADHIRAPQMNGGLVVDFRSEALQLLSNYSRLMLSRPPQELALQLASARHIVELAAVAIATAQAAKPMPDMASAQAARLALILEMIAQRAAEPALGAEDIGRALGVAERSVQALLQHAGTTFSGELREARLKLAEAKLKDRAFAHHSIVDIAMMSGFSDLSTFYRALRQTGRPHPTEIREKKKR